MIIIPVFYAPYIKKEDAKNALKWQRRAIAFAFLAALIVLGIIQFTVTPKLLNLYKDLGEPVPLITQTTSYVVGAIVAICIIISTYLFATPPNYQRLDNVLSKYKEGEMIRTGEILEIKYAILIFLILGLAVGYLVLSNILPVYQLTSRLQ